MKTKYFKLNDILNMVFAVGKPHATGSYSDYIALCLKSEHAIWRMEMANIPVTSDNLQRYLLNNKL